MAERQGGQPGYPEMKREPPVDRRLMTWARSMWGVPKDEEGNPTGVGSYGNLMTDKELEDIIKPLQELLPDEERPRRTPYPEREMTREEQEAAKNRDRERLTQKARQLAKARTEVRLGYPRPEKPERPPNSTNQEWEAMQKLYQQQLKAWDEAHGEIHKETSHETLLEEAKEIRKTEAWIKEGQVAQPRTPLPELGQQAREFGRAMDEIDHTYLMRREGILNHFGHSIRLWWRQNVAENAPPVETALTQLDWWKLTKNGLAPLMIGAAFVGSGPGLAALLPSAVMVSLYGATVSAKDLFEWIDSVKARESRRGKRTEKIDPKLAETMQRRRTAGDQTLRPQEWFSNLLLGGDWRGAAERYGWYDRTPVLVNGDPAFEWTADCRLMTNLGINLAEATQESGATRRSETSIAAQAQAELTPADQADPNVVRRARELQRRVRRLIVAIARAKGAVLRDVTYPEYRAMKPADRRETTIFYLERLKQQRHTKDDKIGDLTLEGQRYIEPDPKAGDPRRATPSTYDLSFITTWLQKNM